MKEENISLLLVKIADIKRAIRFNNENINISTAIYYTGVLAKLEEELTPALT